MGRRRLGRGRKVRGRKGENRGIYGNQSELIY
jgi:hypothetical protein